MTSTFFIFCDKAFINSGFVPQHPPIIFAPIFTNLDAPLKNCSAVISYTASPHLIHGKPAFACTITGIVALVSIFSTIGNNKSGPSEQLTPTASAPNPCNVTTILSGKHPVKLLPFSSKVIVQKTGRFVFSFAANKAAFISYKSIIVSITIISAPDFSP